MADLDIMRDQVWIMVQPHLKWMLAELKTYLEGNPTSTKTAAAAHLVGLTNPPPALGIDVVDRASTLNILLSAYGGTWPEIRDKIIAHPLKVLYAVNPDAGRLMPADALANKVLRMTTDPVEGGWPDDMDWPGDVKKQEHREDANNNQVTKETWEGTLDGKTVKLLCVRCKRE
jgi:hypothetical protein